MATSQPAVDVTVVRAPACHYCEDAAFVLSGLAERYALAVHTVEVDSEEGRALISRHRPPLAPLVVVDGAFFSSGRLPRRRLERLLEARADRASAWEGRDHG